jgi:hypothetical protein
VSEHLAPRQSDATGDHVPGAQQGPHLVGRHSGPVEEESLELTGHAIVDEVLRSIQLLHDRPLEEHVDVFEAAHEKLRAALSGAADRPGSPKSAR